MKTKVKNPRAAIKAILLSDTLHKLQRQIAKGDKNPEVTKKVNEMAVEVKKLAIEGYGETANLKRFLY